MNKRSLTLVAALALGLSVISSIALPDTSDAATPLYNECPAAGADTGCQIQITVNPDGSTTVATDPGQPAMSGTGVLIGVVNNSDALVNSLSLQGVGGANAFDLTGQGVCVVHPSPCHSVHQNGPTGYEGPGTSLSATGGGTTAGTVTFAGGMSPDTSSFFSLRSAPTSSPSPTAALQSDIAVSASPLAPFVNIPFSGQVGTFTVGDYSTSPPTDFSATIDWGDGNQSAGTVSQPGGPGNPYVVTAGPHTYTGAGTPTTTLTVTDPAMTAITNAGSGTSTATVVVQPVTLTAATIAPQLVGTPYSGPVATFTDADTTTTPSSYSASIDWGAQAGGVEQVGPGSITQTGPGAFQVSGTNTYAASGGFTITVSVTIGGVTSTVPVPIVVNVVQVTVPCTGSCSSGPVTTPLQTSSGTTSSSGGTLTVALSDESLLCGTGYDYAPQVTTVTTVGVPATATVRVKVTFLRENLQGPVGAPISVCFQADHAFTDINGNVTPPVLVNGQTKYQGLLPKCVSTNPQRFGPCLGHVSEPLPGWKSVVENIKFPAGDPKGH